MTRIPRVFALTAALALIAAACGEDDPDIAQTGTTAPASEPASGDQVTIIADDIAFDTTTLDATVSQPLSISFDNRDEGIAHNLHVQGTTEGDTKTDIAEGPTTQTLAVTFAEAGRFEFFCDVHPQQMRGAITVTP